MCACTVKTYTYRIYTYQIILICLCIFVISGFSVAPTSDWGLFLRRWSADKAGTWGRSAKENRLVCDVRLPFHHSQDRENDEELAQLLHFLRDIYIHVQSPTSIHIIYLFKSGTLEKTGLSTCQFWDMYSSLGTNSVSFYTVSNFISHIVLRVAGLVPILRASLPSRSAETSKHTCDCVPMDGG